MLARAHDTDAFRQLVERYQTLAFSIALQLVSQPEMAQDLVQEAILQTYLSLDQLRDVTRFKSWFYGIVLHVCQNWRRRQHRTPLPLEVPQAQQVCAEGADPHAIAEERELRNYIHVVLNNLSPQNRVVMLLFYYEELRMDEIAARLNLSLVAVKSRLHKGRNQLRKRLTTIYPELSSVPVSKQKSKRRSTAMANVKIIKVQPQEQRILVLLLDMAGQRVLPLWLSHIEGYPLVVQQKLVDQPGSHGEHSTIEFTSHLLRATGGKIQSVRIEELYQRVLYARVLLNGPGGDQEIEARPGDALALARSEHASILVNDSVLDQLGINLPQEKPLEQQIAEVVDTLNARPVTPSVSKLPRIKEPQNLRFERGLERWELRGDFFDTSGAHWQDYVCGTDPIGPQPGTASGYLKAQVPAPLAFADLRQAILADDSHGKRVRLSADIKTEGVEQEAGLYLRVVDPMETRSSKERYQTTFQGTQGWTHYEVQADVPERSIFILFGISLTGKGQVWFTNVQLE